MNGKTDWNGVKSKYRNEMKSKQLQLLPCSIRNSMSCFLDDFFLCLLCLFLRLLFLILGLWPIGDQNSFLICFLKIKRSFHLRTTHNCSFRLLLFCVYDVSVVDVFALRNIETHFRQPILSDLQRFVGYKSKSLRCSSGNNNE